MLDKALDRPCRASPSAQIVWPSDLLRHVEEHVDLALLGAALHMRSMTRIIQPVPSRQGVHWPHSRLVEGDSRQIALMMSVDCP